jgi:hypothetical protein
MATLHLGIDGWKLAFHLPAVSEVGCEILFRLPILISVWILVLTVEVEGTPRCEVCVRSAATRFAGVF